MRAAERSANRHHAPLEDLRLRCSEMRSACSEIVLTGSCCALRLLPADLGPPWAIEGDVILAARLETMFGAG